jgi:dCTP deaminase
MSIRSDRWIRERAREGMIEPFVEHLEREGVISYGLSSFGYDLRAAAEWRVFVNAFNTVVDPKAFDEASFVELEDDVCIIPPNSFALTRSVEYLRIPDDVLVVALGKSSYARTGIVANVTPLEPGWEGHVTLELSSDEPGTWRVVVVTPDGTSRPYDARWDGARLTLASDDAPAFDAADALGPQGRTLTLTWWDGGATEVPTDRFVARPSAPEPRSAADGTEADAPDVPDSNRPARPATASRGDDDDAASSRDPDPAPVAEEPADDAPADDAPDAGANRPGGNAGDAGGDDGAQDDDADAGDAPPPSSNR